MPDRDLTLQGLLDHLLGGGRACKDRIKRLLDVSDPAGLRRLFAAARRCRTRFFGPTVFFYGFLYFSTHCRNNCRFCRYRRANRALARYRKDPDEILAAAAHMAESGVHLIDLTMGEDPFWHESPERVNEFTRLAGRVARETGLPVMASPGVLPDNALWDLANAGVSWYACYQETLTPALYSRLRPGQDFEFRLSRKKSARDAGLLVEEGILTGVGESPDDIADAILHMRDLPADQARVMRFVPQAGIPLSPPQSRDALRELVTIAVMRIVMPDRLIPASLDVDGLDGLKDRLMAGANVVTSIVPPGMGLSGVAHHSLDISESRRQIHTILPILESCGLEPAHAREYRNWVSQRMFGRTSPLFTSNGFYEKAFHL